VERGAVGGWGLFPMRLYCRHDQCECINLEQVYLPF